MIKLYLKTLSISLIITLLLLGSLYSLFFIFLAQVRLNVNKLLVQGDFAVIQQKLAQSPSEQWDNILYSLQAPDRPPAEITSIETLTLSFEQKVRLNQRQVIFTSRPSELFLNYGL